MRISDWSSDVCSSDLLASDVALKTCKRDAGGTADLEGFQFTGCDQAVAGGGTDRDHSKAVLKGDGERLHCHLLLQTFPALSRCIWSYRRLDFGRRSEERRVGKECVSTCRSRGWLYH